MSSSIQVAVTEIPQIAWIVDNKNAFLTVTEAGKCTSKAPADAVSGENPPQAHSLPLAISSHGGSSKGALWVLLILRAPVLFMRVLLSQPNHFSQRPYLLVPSSWGLGLDI